MAKEASAFALEHGLLVNAVRPDAVRLAPPLLVRDDELDDALRILGNALVAVRASQSAPAPE